MIRRVRSAVRDRPPFGIDPDPLDDEETRRLEETPGVVQPLANQLVDRNQWKANPFVRLTDPEERNPHVRAAGMDYLLTYWMGRYFNLIRGTETGE